MFLPLYAQADADQVESEFQSPDSLTRPATPEYPLVRSLSETRLRRLARIMPNKQYGGSMPSILSPYSYASGYVEAEKLSPVITKGAPRLQKRLIVCCDGTWNNGLNTDPHQVTNVLKLARCIFPEDRRTFPPTPQLVFYQAGLGTTDLFALNLAQGATGTGISAKIREAYAFIAQNYIPGDEVFLFGFSRGAYTARTIASLIADIGILTNAGMEDFYQVLAAYQVRGEKTERSVKAEEFLNNYRRGGPKRMREMPEGTLKCVGVWDTVGALGIPRFYGRKFNLLGFRDHKLSHHIQYAFHAIAIHETRKEFMPTKWQAHSKPSGSNVKDPQVFKQVWFSGSHSDVGGGNVNHDLSDISLIWMVANLMHYKLLSIDKDYLLTLPAPKAEWGKQKPTDPRTGVMMLTVETIRDLPTKYDPSTRETIHQSVGSQPTLAPELAEIFKNESHQLIEKLLPFEIQMVANWGSFVGRTENSLYFEHEAQSQTEGNVSKRMLFKELWAAMVGILDVGRETLAKLRVRDEEDEGAEELAYKTLETPTCIETPHSTASELHA